MAANRLAEAARDAARKHRSARRKWERVELMLGAPATVLALVSSIGAAALTWTGRKPAIAATLAVTTAFATGARARIRASERARGHATKVQAFAEIRSDAVDFAEVDLFSSMDPASLRGRYGQLADRFIDLSSGKVRYPTHPDRDIG